MKTTKKKVSCAVCGNLFEMEVLPESVGFDKDIWDTPEAICSEECYDKLTQESSVLVLFT